MRDLYSEVTARIVAELETGAALPWRKPWAATAGANQPANAVTRRPYSGVNVLLLWSAMTAHGWAVPRFLTFKQAQEAGGHVRKGEHGTRVYFVKQLTVADTRDGAEEDDVRSLTMLREYTVFNVAQCDGLPAKLTALPPAPPPRNTDARDAIADEFIASTGARIVEGNGEAYYRPGDDSISMPAFERFDSSEAFYSTEFHELTHWTGHKARLERDFRGRFGDAAYAAEELVAELGAAFLCAEFAFDQTDNRSAAYIQSWIKLLKSDKRAIFTAASKAQAAADYLRGLALAESTAKAA